MRNLETIIEKARETIQTDEFMVEFLKEVFPSNKITIDFDTTKKEGFDIYNLCSSAVLNSKLYIEFKFEESLVSFEWLEEYYSFEQILFSLSFERRKEIEKEIENGCLEYGNKKEIIELLEYEEFRKLYSEYLNEPHWSYELENQLEQTIEAQIKDSNNYY